MALDREDYDPRDVEFTGVLTQRLKPGEDPAAKLPALCEAFGVDGGNYGALALALASRFVEGFKPEAQPRRKRKTRGRPNLLTSILDARNSWLSEVLLPDWFMAGQQERLFNRMNAIRAAAAERGRTMKVPEAAYQVIGEEKIDGFRNLFFVESSIAKAIRDEIAQSVAHFYTHRKRRQQQNAEALQTFKRSPQQEARERALSPQRMVEETFERVIGEVSRGRAAGRHPTDILEDILRRAPEIANDIVERSS